MTPSSPVVGCSSSVPTSTLSIRFSALMYGVEGSKVMEQVGFWS